MEEFDRSEFERMIDEMVEVNRAYSARTACLLHAHWLTCPRCYADEDFLAVRDGRACFLWDHSDACHSAAYTVLFQESADGRR